VTLRRGVVRGRLPARGHRAPTSWARAVPVTGTTIALSTKALVASVVLSNPGIGETVRRCRGTLRISSDQAAQFEEISGAMGAIVVNDVAFALGVTGIPGPVTEANDDGWFVWLPFQQVSVGTQGTSPATVFSSHASLSYEWDSKAMRKVAEGFSVAFMVENASDTHGLDVELAFSILSSLS